MRNDMTKMRAMAVALILAVAAVLASPAAYGQAAALHRVGGRYFAPEYRFWGAAIASGNSATGSQTITACTQGVLRDGTPFNPFGTQNGTFAAITVDPQGGSSVTETVTPTAVSGPLSANPAGYPQTLQCYNVTASFSNLHGASLSPTQIISGDFGVQEALNDAAANGGGEVYWEVDAGNVTLSTSGTTTTTTVNVPKTFTNLGGSAHVITTVATATAYGVGITSSTSAFINACTSLTAGLDCSQFQVAPTAVAHGAGLGSLLITTTGTPSAGVVHVKVWGVTEVQSNL
jgi:hypothetical protein